MAGNKREMKIIPSNEKSYARIRLTDDERRELPPVHLKPLRPQVFQRPTAGGAASLLLDKIAECPPEKHEWLVARMGVELDNCIRRLRMLGDSSEEIVSDGEGP